jgi:peptide chain release factor 1
MDSAQETYRLREEDIKIFVTKDTGPGGQHRNKTESCIVMRHIPTGIEAKAASKSQHNNRREARLLLEQRVIDHYTQKAASVREDLRRSQVGSGMRGDKIRTYREQDDTVVDHRTEKRCRLSDVQAGKLDKLWQ